MTLAVLVTVIVKIMYAHKCVTLNTVCRSHCMHRSSG